MPGTAWLRENADKLIDCPIGKVTESACNKRVQALKNPGLWRGAYHYYKCLECPRSGITDGSVLAYKNFEIEQEGGGR